MRIYPKPAPDNMYSWGPWKPWFAWRPVRTESDILVWFELIERQVYHCGRLVNVMHYRLPSER